MDMSALIKNPIFYIGVLAILGIVFWENISKLIGRVGIKTKGQYFLLLGLAFLLVGGIGIFDNSGTGSFTETDTTTNFGIQLVSAFSFNGTDVTGANIDVMSDVRATEEQVSADSQISDGLLTVTRRTADGTLPPASYTVTVGLPADYPDGAMPTPILYNLVTRDANKRSSVYLHDGGVASTSDVRETLELTFAEGEATAQLGMLINLDADNFGHLAQYDEKNIDFFIEGQRIYTLRVIKNDA